jgi:hypothetical protein
LKLCIIGRYRKLRLQEGVNRNQLSWFAIMKTRKPMKVQTINAAKSIGPLP